MNIRFLIICTILSGLSLTSSLGQNTPVNNGLPSDPMTGVITYPPNLNASPNTTPTFYNYKRTYTPLAAMQTIPSFDNTSASPILVNTVYGDGLGNSIMEISRTNVGDIITPTYNRVSKTKISLLPYSAAHHLKFQHGTYNNQNLQYKSLYGTESTTTTSTAYSKTVGQIDPVTGMTVVKSYAPGKAFVGQERGNTVTTAIHGGNEIFKVEYTSSVLCRNGYYAAGSLTEKIETSPHGELVTYYDNANRIVCKKTYLQNKAIKQYTYYVYNDLGKLIFVVPPKAAGLFINNTCLTTPQIDQLCYSYIYDVHGNPIVKGTPGKNGKEYIVYDRLHRPVMVQSPLMASGNEWAFTLYDNRGRVTMSGVYAAGNDDRNALQDYIANQASYVTTNMYGSLLYYIVNYMSSSYPGSITNCNINTINYYDDYTTGPAAQTSYDTSYNPEFLTGLSYETPTPYYFAVGKPVATKQRVVNDYSYGNNFVNGWITSVFYYDEKGRVIQTKTVNPWNDLNPGAILPGHWDVSAQQYDFVGNVVYSVNKHHLPRANKPATEVRVRNIYNTTTGRLEEMRMQLDSEPWQTLQKYTYDAFGKITHKWIGGTEEQNYTYNMNGKMIGVNNNYITTPSSSFLPTMTFAEAVSFEQGFSQRRYDGLLSGFKWRTAGGNVSAYGYSYDDMGRMIAADFREWSDSLTYGKKWNKLTRDFSVEGISFDLNGNMESMKQYGYDQSFQPDRIDDLSYTYNSNSNQLASVTDVGADSPIDDFDNSVSNTSYYQYDADGNLEHDNLKDLYLEYNYQDLPFRVTKGSSGASIKNIYDGVGTLLQKHINDNSVDTRYLYWGPFVYRNDSLLYIQHAEGRCRWVNDTGVFRYDYFIKDHLGNVRTVVTTDAQSLSNYYLATHEVASANIEELIFENIADVRSSNPVYGTGNYDAALLNGNSSTTRIGTSLLLQVMAGDKVNLQGFSYHGGKGEDDDFAMPEEMFASLITTLADGNGGFAGEGEIPNEEKTLRMNNIFNNDNFVIYEDMKSGNTDPDLPRAYLNYLFFDENYVLQADLSRIMQVSGNPNNWEQLSTPDIPVQQTGHLLIYISNEQAMDVFFDNIAVTYTKGRLIEENHYYPHGLLAKVTSAIGIVPENKYKHQGKLLQDELGMQLYDFHARQYDPQIGRFWGIDPADQYPSGYTGMGNDPANMIDPSGMEASQYGVGGQPNTWHNTGAKGAAAMRRSAMLYHEAFMQMLMIEEGNNKVMLSAAEIINPDGPVDWGENGVQRTAQSDPALKITHKIIKDQLMVNVEGGGFDGRDQYGYQPVGSPGMEKTPDGRVVSSDAAKEEKEALNKYKQAEKNAEFYKNHKNIDDDGVDLTGPPTAGPGGVLPSWGLKLIKLTTLLNPAIDVLSAVISPVELGKGDVRKIEDILGDGPAPDFPTGDGSESPGEGWEWKGKKGSTPGSKEGSWHSPDKGSLRPDLNHGPPQGPHWDWKGPNSGTWYRIYPDGRVIPK